MRYIGGKSLLLGAIEQIINKQMPSVYSALDLFAGSGAVSRYFKKKGLRTVTNDFLYFSYVLQQCSIGLNRTPSFRTLGIKDPIRYLNGLRIQDTDFEESQCFIYNNYTPAGECKRMYFQPANGLKIDIIRLTIEKWRMRRLIDDKGYYYLLSSLLQAVPYVANITGVYSAYLKFWDARSYHIMELKKPEIISNGKKNQCLNEDYVQVLGKRCDLLYADPPYNSREYLPNYHILETIARYDYPQLSGVTGMRNYQGQKSAFCRKSTVYDAFEPLLRDCRCRYILISYNNEGLISTDQLSRLCEKYACEHTFCLFEYDYRRYKNKIPNSKEGLKEQLYFLKRR